MQMTGYELLAFQSALPRGERQDWPTHLKKGFDISIRAPARGATNNRKLLTLMDFYFNPRSREGSDMIIEIKQQERGYFNPRSREGSDVVDF